MTVIKLLIINSFFVASYSIMEPGAVCSFTLIVARAVTHEGIFSVPVIRSQYHNLRGVVTVGQITKIFSRGNINFIWKRIGGMAGFFSGGEYHQWLWKGY